MDGLNTGPNLELGERMNSSNEYSCLFGEGVASQTLEVFDQRSLLDLMSIHLFGGGSGDDLHV